MTKREATVNATMMMLAFLDGTKEITKDAARAYGLTWRYLDGRKDVYSTEQGQWHVLVSDNGGQIIEIVDCSRV